MDQPDQRAIKLHEVNLNASKAGYINRNTKNKIINKTIKNAEVRTYVDHKHDCFLVRILKLK